MSVGRDFARSFAGRVRRAREPLSYAEETVESPWKIVRNSHRSRLAVSAREILRTDPAVVIDFGSGDGALLAALAATQRGASLELVILYEPDPGHRATATHLAASVDLGARVVVCSDVEDVERCLGHRQADCISTLGVLEHLMLPDRQAFYDFVQRFLASTGTLVVDLPIEVGPSVLIKEGGRRLLKSRKPEYTWTALLRRAVGNTAPDPRRFDPALPTSLIYSHSGFDHRPLYREMERLFERVASVATPMERVPWWLVNQELISTWVRRSVVERASPSSTAHSTATRPNVP